MAHPNNKIAPLENDYHREQLAQLKIQQKQITFRRRRLAVIFLVALIILGFSGFHLIKDAHKLAGLQKDEATTIAKEKSLADQEQDLNDDVNLLQDEEYVGKLARSRYLLSKDGEQVYTIPSQSVTDSGTTDSSSTTTSSENK